VSEQAIKVIVFILSFVLGWFLRTVYNRWQDWRMFQSIPTIPLEEMTWMSLFEAGCKEHNQVLKIPYMKDIKDQEAKIRFDCGCEQTIVIPASPKEEVFGEWADKERKQKED